MVSHSRASTIKMLELIRPVLNVCQLRSISFAKILAVGKKVQPQRKNVKDLTMRLILQHPATSSSPKPCRRFV